ncbi:hypothetical protein [Petroclostridium sp. X23]|uniref:hypothetical protein n=1 Tax=Petroclostridium sp. X23 TaxID=3045146 RepID=UPI0024AE58A5|nr:hypothetical protein [Petroclostridium sp. X23]WHH60049.1 hypothetical protein QKW49_04705 [Petroclostridium sp. X23]
MNENLKGAKLDAKWLMNKLKRITFIALKKYFMQDWTQQDTYIYHLEIEFGKKKGSMDWNRQNNKDVKLPISV